MSPAPKVSVLVISYNRSADLRKSLTALRECGYPDLEIIVIDNASTDDAVSVARSFEGVKVVVNAENTGFAAANDQAFALSTGDYIALVNNDAVLDRNWIASLVHFLEANPEAAAAGGKQYLWNDENQLGNKANPYYGWSRLDDNAWTPAPLDPPDLLREVATLSGAAVMVRKKAIEDVGGQFLEPLFFTYYEETDFFARAIAKGWKLYYLPEAICWHRVRASTASNPKRYYLHMYRNRVLFAQRNFDDEKLAKLMLIAERDGTSAKSGATRSSMSGVVSDDERAGSIEAWEWIEQNRELLAKHRQNTHRSPRGYHTLVSEIEQRAGYYGQTRPEVVALVPRDAKYVIDVGCAGGGVGYALRSKRVGVEVRGVELFPEAAARAKRVLDDVLVGDATADLPSSWPRPDCVIFADVLEHLVDPWSVLALWRERLSPGGALVVSLPNVLHYSVTRGLLKGRWDYQPEGVLDRTHLRFFTPKTAIEMIESCGFVVERAERATTPGPTKTTDRLAKLWTIGQKRREKRVGKLAEKAAILDAVTLQVLLVARKKEALR